MTGDKIYHPIQSHNCPNKAISEITLRAYEVYCELYRPQPAMVEGGCRGGFGAGELMAFLYARTFPKAEWKDRFHEAINGLGKR